MQFNFFPDNGDLSESINYSHIGGMPPPPHPPSPTPPSSPSNPSPIASPNATARLSSTHPLTLCSPSPAGVRLCLQIHSSQLLGASLLTFCRVNISPFGRGELLLLSNRKKQGLWGFRPSYCLCKYPLLIRSPCTAGNEQALELNVLIGLLREKTY